MRVSVRVRLRTMVRVKVIPHIIFRVPHAEFPHITHTHLATVKPAEHGKPF